MRLELSDPAVVFIGGPPRSGTTLARDLLNSHGQITVGDEMPLDSLSSLRALLDQLEHRFFTETWRCISPDTHVQRKLLVLKAAIMAVSSDSKLQAVGRSRIFGVKTPGSEADFGFFEKHLGAIGPRYLVCLRHPVKTWVSIQTKMPHLFKMSFKEFKRGYTHATVTGLGEGDIRRERIRLFQADLLAASTPRERKREVTSLLEWLGLSMNAEVERFLDGFPVVNAGKNIRPDVDERELWESAEKDWASDPKFCELCARVGYAI